MIENIFYLLIFLTIYTYVLFPLILLLLVKLKKRKSENLMIDTEKYKVSIICAMYNEEKIVKQKINNFLQLNHKCLKLYVGSDGSIDKTNEILHEYAHNEKIMFFEFPRRGKVHVINDLIEKVEGEIVVFTDANWMFKTDTLFHLLKCFADPTVGAVTGKLMLINDQKTGEGFYRRYETNIKKLESQLKCVIGASGACYAVRKNLLKPLPINTINDDFTISMRVIEQGFGVVYSEDAIVYEVTSHNDKVEFKRHIRDGAGHYRALIYLYKLFNPFRPKVFFLYISHRVIRWFVPIFLTMLLVFPLFMEMHRSILFISLAQMIFYLLVFVGWITKTKVKLFYIPYYFIFINIALGIGLIRNILGIQKVSWNRTER